MLMLTRKEQEKEIRSIPPSDGAEGPGPGGGEGHADVEQGGAGEGNQKYPTFRSSSIHYLSPTDS